MRSEAGRIRLLAGVLIGLAAAGGLGGCSSDVRGVAPPPESWPPPPMALPSMVPPPVVPKVVRLDIPAAIAGDPEAQRLLAIRRLAEEGVIPVEDAARRRDANLGALLPYSAPPPAVGLARPLMVQDVIDRIVRLAADADGPAIAAGGEIAFLLDGLLPADPKVRAAAARIDAEALALGRARIQALAGLDLISPEELQRELAAIDLGEQVVAAMPPPPPPPPPEKKKPARKKAAGDGLKPGDVPGGALPPPAAGKIPMGVHLLSMASDTLTGKAVDALKKEFPELAAMEFKAVKTTLPELGTTYRLLAGPLSRTEADALCKALRTKGQSCAVAGF